MRYINLRLLTYLLTGLY